MDVTVVVSSAEAESCPGSTSRMGTLAGAYFFEEPAEGAIEYARLSLTRLVYFFWTDDKFLPEKEARRGAAASEKETARAW